MKKLFATALATLGLLAGAMPAAAQGVAAASYPNAPIKLIVPYTAGGVTDIMGRLFAEQAGKRLGQPVIIENKTGANGTLGGVQMLSADPSGYYLTMLPIGTFRMPHITGAQFNPLKDFTYISVISGFNYYIAVNAGSPWKSVGDLVDYAKKSNGAVSYGTPGANSSQHIGMAQLGVKAGADWTHVPFKGDADAISALMGNHIQAVVSSSSILPYVTSGKIRVLASLGDTRSPDLPDVPTLKELGYPIVHTSPMGIAGPKGMDPAVVKKLEAAFREAYDDPEYQAGLKKLGMSALYMNAADYHKYAIETFNGEREALRSMGVQVK